MFYFILEYDPHRQLSGPKCWRCYHYKILRTYLVIIDIMYSNLFQNRPIITYILNKRSVIEKIDIRVSIELSDRFELSDTIHFYIRKMISQCLESTKMMYYEPTAFSFWHWKRRIDHFLI